MKKWRIVSIIVLMLAFSASAYALDKTSHIVTLTADSVTNTVKAVVAVDKGDAVVGHFGLSYNTEKLSLLTVDETNVPETVPDKTDDGKSYLSMVVKSLSSSVVITSETNTASSMINTVKGYVLFGWYATKDVDSINSDAQGGVIAEITFGLKEGVSVSDLVITDVTPAGKSECEHLADWSKGIIVINSENKIFSSFAENEDELLVTKVSAKYLENDDEEDENENEASSETADENEAENEDKDVTVNETDTGVSVEKLEQAENVATVSVTSHTFDNYARFIWEKSEQDDVYEYVVVIKDADGKVAKTVSGIIGVCRSVTVKDLLENTEYSVTVYALDDKYEVKAKSQVNIKTEE